MPNNSSDKGRGLRTAIVYDFDGTLAEGNIMDHSLIPSLGQSKEAFWDEVKCRAKRHDSDEILIYMHYMLELAQGIGLDLTEALLREHGGNAPLFEGVGDWFARINEHGRSLGLQIEHYIVSSGLREMILGSTVSDEMRIVFASGYIFDDDGKAKWPGVAINYTNKTQFLFRINKGIDNTFDNKKINEWVPLAERPIPFERIIFIGDGETDIPAMKMVRHQGGHSVAVFDPGRWVHQELQRKVHRLIAEDRCHFVAPADYSANQQLEITIKGIMGRIVNNAS